MKPESSDKPKRKAKRQKLDKRFFEPKDEKAKLELIRALYHNIPIIPTSEAQEKAEKKAQKKAEKKAEKQKIREEKARAKLKEKEDKRNAKKEPPMSGQPSSTVTSASKSAFTQQNEQEVSNIFKTTYTVICERENTMKNENMLDEPISNWSGNLSMDLLKNPTKRNYPEETNELVGFHFPSNIPQKMQSHQSVWMNDYKRNSYDSMEPQSKKLKFNENLEQINLDPYNEGTFKQRKIRLRAKEFCVREEDSRVRCIVCNQLYTKVNNCRRHYVDKHLRGETSHKCIDCGKKYSRIDNLRSHIKQFHAHFTLSTLLNFSRVDSVTPVPPTPPHD